MVRTLLALDYPGRRAEAKIADLGLEAHGFEVAHLLTAPLPDELTGRAYAEKLFSTHGVADREIAGVLAYCASAPLAQELARHMVEAGSEAPPLFFFDAAPLTAQDITDDYTAVLRQIDASGFEESGSQTDVASLIGTPEELVAAMREEMTRYARNSLAEDLFDDEEVALASEQIVRVYLDLLTHQIAAYHGAAPAWGGDVVNIVSAGNAFQGDWPGARATRVVRTAHERASLLADPATRDTVLSLLA
ncbi:hypothetical protein [Streptomyces sp. NPDC056883]|uniref:hypothetical protein n=1 Tax=Streptomyces sp. NPDC056883 TaxID=3345959 RepID=UPI003681F485